MSRNSIELEFADGSYTFALPLPRIDELQRKTGVGIGALFARIMEGVIQLQNGDTAFAAGLAKFHVLDIVETLRQGLIGGGKGMVNDEEIAVTPALANKLIDNYVLEEPLVAGWKMAAAVLGACIVGYNEKKAEPARARAPRKPRTRKAASTTA